MAEKIVVSPDLTPDWLRKKKRIFGELEEQLIRGFETPGSGLTLAQLQLAVEHRNPFEVPPFTILWTVTSDGRTAQELIRDIGKKDRRVSDCARDIMGKPEFKTTKGETYRLIGIRGDEFKDGDRTTRGIFKEAKRRGYLVPPVEVAPLLREKLSQEELGYPYVAVFHEPICDSYGYPYILELYRLGTGVWLHAWSAGDIFRWPHRNLFLFLAPQAF